MSLTPHTRVGPYEIAGQIGAGGMGEVYRARDLRLGRDVAIKMLPARLAGNERALERFRREARAVGALNHPHVCTLFDAGEYEGQPYFVMELLEGATLQSRIASRPLAPSQVIDWAVQLSDALGAAHARGIVHRDLKPANVFITTRGDAKILDFGIAKLLDLGAPEDATTLAALTSLGTAIGTAAYMSPEQIRSDEIDGRTDLFSLGVVLYEAATGKHPFGGATATVVASILGRTPEPVRALNPDAPEALERIIQRLLEKDRELRYQQAGDLRADLKRALRAPAAAQEAADQPARIEVTPPKSIAVLPFRNIGGDPEHAFFSDGLAEDLIDALSRIPALRVASRNSTFRFRDPDTPPADIGAALGVDALVQGSVRRAGNTLRVTAQLVEAQTGFQIWSEKYDREMADLFEIQDDIVAALARALTPALTGGGTGAVRRPTDNLEAYECYLKGRHYWHQRSPTTLKLAIQSFEQAIALDADYALAYAGLADSWALYRPYGWLPVDACRPPAERAVERAMALAPQLAEVQFSKGLHDFYFQRHWRQAEAHFRKAVDLNPRSSLARAYFGVFLASDYRLDEARRQSAASIELDPLSPFIHGIAGLTALAGGDVAGAEQHGRRALELQPDYLLSFWLLAITLDNAGRLDEAEVMINRAVAMSRAPIFISMLAKIHARQGHEAGCAAIEAELEDRRTRGEYISRACDVVIATGRNDVEGLRRALRACVLDDTSWFTVRLGPGPGLEAFRSDPEVDALLEELYDGARR
jgi:serine/threonine protein kinase